MAPDTQAENSIAVLEAQIRECFGRVVYSHKTHEKCADIYAHRSRLTKGAQLVLSALVTGGLLTALLGDANKTYTATVIAAILSTALLVLNSYAKDLDPGQQVEAHRKTATALWDIRESYLSLLTDVKSGVIAPDAARSLRDKLQSAAGAVYAVAPRTLPKAYAEASKALKLNEELTFTDEEIDKFLPAALRKI
jgi:hypothetical protein